MKTREQRKRERVKTAAMVIALSILWICVLTMMVEAWANHPAEQQINGYEYMEQIGGEFDGR